jgi:cobalt/nickel transport system permease protein
MVAENGQFRGMTPILADADGADSAPVLSPIRLTGRKRTKFSFLEKTISGIARSIEQAIFTEEHARKDAFLQRRDPRAKLVAFLVLILAVSLARTPLVIALLYACTLSAAVASQLPMDFYVKRVWLGIPFFAGIVVIPSIFLTPGQPVLSVPIGFTTLTATREGFMGAAILVLRVGASVSLAVLLVLTTKWSDVLKSLRALHVPTVFVLVLGMTYRYIFLFLHAVTEMHYGRMSRTIAATSGAEQRRWIVASLGALFSKSLRLSSDVYQAMLSRGFHGEIYSYSDYSMRPTDWLMIAGVVALSLAVTVLDRWYLH